MTMKLRLVSLACLILAFLAPAAEGYVYETCRGNLSVWGSSSETFFASPVSFPAGSGARASLTRGATAWNAEAPGSNWTFALAFLSLPSNSLGNGFNNILATTDFDFDGALAVTRRRRHPCIWPFWKKRIIEADILFDSSLTWDVSTNPPSAHTVTNMTLVALHEFGHSFGLGHENGELATMNSFYPGGGTFGNGHVVQPLGDDTAGARAGYGTSGSPRDVAASAFEQTGAGSSSDIDPPFNIFRGIPQTFGVTISNRGVQNESVKVDFYLSTNRFISQFDTFVGSGTFFLAAGRTFFINASVVIPTSVAPGSYHFGYIVDPDNTIPEVDENNNAVGYVDAGNVTGATPPNVGPTACFTANPEWGTEPLTVQFDASCSSDFDGSIVSYTWDLDDGTIKTGQVISHTYDAGDYFPLLTVQDNNGATDTEGTNVYVECSEGVFCEQ